MRPIPPPPYELTITELRAVNERLAACHLDAVQQRCLLQVVVDESGDDAHLGQAEPGSDELGPILQEQSHGVTLLEATSQENVTDPVTKLVQLETDEETLAGDARSTLPTRLLNSSSWKQTGKR